ncbi:hypothetical protein CEXT_394281 [Caerostris extrusa]|uniref:Uncharacterized protein n=1 Tax=Caerostris extrusa TaxID=172846 RepID=A0AAV4XKX9_CAEEX|nr:hypothetical protein CEXT_394281 [Caerostris extrusa]
MLQEFSDEKKRYATKTLKISDQKYVQSKVLKVTALEQAGQITNQRSFTPEPSPNDIWRAIHFSCAAFHLSRDHPSPNRIPAREPAIGSQSGRDTSAFKVAPNRWPAK